MRWISLSVALISISVLFGCTNCSPKTFGIFGKVVSKVTRQPIANATVTLLKDGIDVGSVKTSENGEFGFPNLQPGSYALVVTAEGYLTTQVGVTLGQEQRLSVTVEMISEQEGPPTDIPITD